MTDNIRVVMGQNCVAPPRINPVLSGVMALCVVASWSINGCTVTLPQKPPLYAGVFSTESHEQTVYTNGNINLVWDGISMTSELLTNYKRIDEISHLKENWNGNGAQAFSTELLEKVHNLVSSLNKQPFISPTARESIQLEYEKDNGDYLEFEVFENGIVTKFFYSEGKGTTENIEPHMINKAVDDFYG